MEKKCTIDQIISEKSEYCRKQKKSKWTSHKGCPLNNFYNMGAYCDHVVGEGHYTQCSLDVTPDTLYQKIRKSINYTFGI